MTRRPATPAMKRDFERLVRNLRPVGVQHDAHVETYDREMQDRADQKWVGNGGSLITECGTLIGGDDV